MTKKQQMAAEFMIQYPLKQDKDIAAMVGFTPQALCKVKKTPEFKEYLDKRLKETWKDSIRAAQNTMIELAKQGDRAAAQYILDSAGYQAPQEINLNTNVIKVEVVDD